MSSGLYSALTGAVARTQNLEMAVNNLANVGNIGFKGSRVSFESIYQENVQNTHGKGKNFTRAGARYIDFSQGNIEKTGRSLDLAIKGDGFFKVAGEDGFLYTRKGDLKIDNQGSLVVSASGLQVVGEGGPIFLPHSEVHIGKQGEVSADGLQVGQLSLYDIEDKAAMIQRENGMWELAEGAVDVLSDTSELFQGALEHSNVNALRLTTEIIDINRSYAAYIQTMKTFSDLGEKARSIGEVG